jgi:hypothetical protein
VLTGTPPPRQKVCKVFETDTLGLDFDVGLRPIYIRLALSALCSFSWMGGLGADSCQAMADPGAHVAVTFLGLISEAGPPAARKDDNFKKPPGKQCNKSKDDDRQVGRVSVWRKWARAFQPAEFTCLDTQSVALGWYKTRLQRSGRQRFVVMERLDEIDPLAARFTCMGVEKKLYFKEWPGDNFLLAVNDLALWCNWLTRRPLKAKSPGSSPGNATKSASFCDFQLESCGRHRVEMVG